MTGDNSAWRQRGFDDHAWNVITTGLKQHHLDRYEKTVNLVVISFDDKPIWWTPQTLGDSLTKYNFKLSQYNEQTLIVGDDSTHVYVCDQAL